MSPTFVDQGRMYVKEEEIKVVAVVCMMTLAVNHQGVANFTQSGSPSKPDTQG
jgi:hypothetical protein